MKATINYKGANYENVELASIKQNIVSFRIGTNKLNYCESIEQLVNDGADVDFYSQYAFVIVPREDVLDIICL